MELSEVIYKAEPTTIGLHGADDLVARVKNYQGSCWVDLGEIKNDWFEPRINLFFRGPDAAAKAERLAAAINAAMGETAAPALAHAAE